MKAALALTYGAAIGLLLGTMVSTLANTSAQKAACERDWDVCIATTEIFSAGEPQ